MHTMQNAHPMPTWWLVLSGQRPARIKYPNRSGLGACGNDQRLTIDVTPSPHLEDLRQGPRMAGHASYSTLGHHPSNPTSHHTRVPLRVDPPFQVTIVQSKYPCVHNIRGIRGVTLVGFLLDVSVKVHSEEHPSLGSHMR